MIDNKDWKAIVSAVEAAGYNVSVNSFIEDNEDDTELIAHNNKWSIRIKFEWDDLQLNIDDDDSDFGCYYTPVEQMDSRLFVLCIGNILQMIDIRYK